MAMTPLDKIFFNEFKTGVINAHWVNKDRWILFSGTRPVVLSSDVPPEFRIAVTTEPVPGHTITSGTIAFDNESLTFTQPARLATRSVFMSLPEVHIDELDCMVTIECISPEGAPLYRETLKPFEMICFPRTRILRDQSGSGYMQTDYDIYTDEVIPIGSRIRFVDPHQNGKLVEVYIKARTSAVDLEFENTQPFRVYNCA
ncbi:MAG: hypothetical protein N3G75_07645 [Methanothrix sp.]|nr:hypothetical protein [Methanothrix sp.]MCX8207687.1 hypothetical protein [Methanothrix sp.]